jgi:hypothetical protein
MDKKGKFDGHISLTGSALLVQYAVARGTLSESELPAYADVGRQLLERRGL